jgi:hypothetical protein
MGDARGDSVDHCLVDWAGKRYANPVGLIVTWNIFKHFSRWEICHEPNPVSYDCQKDLIFHVDHVSLRGFKLED